MGMVRLTWSTIKFLGPIMSLKWVKLGISNLVFRLIVVSTSVCMMDYPGMRCVQVLANKWHGTRCKHGYSGRLIGNCMWPITWHQCLWPWVTLNVISAVETFINLIFRKMCHTLPMICLHVNWKAHVTCNFNCDVETGGLQSCTL